MLVVITVDRDKCFRLVDVGCRGLEKSTTVGKKGEAARTSILSTHGMSSHGLDTVTLLLAVIF
jgi:hypothetical protein